MLATQLPTCMPCVASPISSTVASTSLLTSAANTAAKPASSASPAPSPPFAPPHPRDPPQRQTVLHHAPSAPWLRATIPCRDEFGGNLCLSNGRGNAVHASFKGAAAGVGAWTLEPGCAGRYEPAFRDNDID